MNEAIVLLRFKHVPENREREIKCAWVAISYNMVCVQDVPHGPYHKVGVFYDGLWTYSAGEGKDEKYTDIEIVPVPTLTKDELVATCRLLEDPMWDALYQGGAVESAAKKLFSTDHPMFEDQLIEAD